MKDGWVWVEEDEVRTKGGAVALGEDDDLDGEDVDEDDWDEDDDDLEDEDLDEEDEDWEDWDEDDEEDEAFGHRRSPFRPSWE